MEFAFSDILSQRGDFYRDIRTVGDVSGTILECRAGQNSADYVQARLWMPEVLGAKYFVMTLIAFLDPCFEADTLIVPEFNLSLNYKWGLANFKTEKIITALESLNEVKPAGTDLCEWDIICVSAAVCAVYEHIGRINYCEPKSWMAYEYIDSCPGFDLIRYYEYRKGFFNGKYHS